MNLYDAIKRLTIQDIILISLDELGYSDTEIAFKMGISTSTIHNTKKRLKTLLEPVNALQELVKEPVEYGNHEVNIIVDSFKANFGTTKVTKYDRFAAKRLADKHSAPGMVTVIAALSASTQDKYSPSVNSISQLEDKLPQVIKFLKSKANDQEIEL